MNRIIVALLMALGLVFSTVSTADAVVGDGPALQANTLSPKCVGDSETKVRVGVRNVGNKDNRLVTVWWKNDSAYTGKTVAKEGRTILTHKIESGEEIEFYVYPTRNPDRILLHDTVTSIC